MSQGCANPGLNYGTPLALGTCGPKHPLTAASLQALRQEYTHSIDPARTLAAEAQKLEHTLINQAYALTPEEIALMWQTAPPRMPIAQPGASTPKPEGLS